MKLYQNLHVDWVPVAEKGVLINPLTGRIIRGAEDPGEDSLKRRVTVIRAIADFMQDPGDDVPEQLADLAPYVRNADVLERLANAEICRAPDVTQRLDAWRNHILTKGNLGGVELASDDYEALVKMGPNALPEVFDAFEKEQDPHVLYYYAILVRRIAHFDEYRYSSEPLTLRGCDMQDTDEASVPLLSTRLNSRGLTVLKSADYAVDHRSRLVQWWKFRKDFLARKKESVVNITGRTEDQFSKIDSKKDRLLQKTVKCYGIYNIPMYIDIIREDNSPIVFADFLRISNNALFQQLECTGDPKENAQKITAAFPTREAKVKVIREWWASSANTYTALDDVHVAIDKAVQGASGDADG